MGSNRRALGDSPTFLDCFTLTPQSYGRDPLEAYATPYAVKLAGFEPAIPTVRGWWNNRYPIAPDSSGFEAEEGKGDENTPLSERLSKGYVLPSFPQYRYCTSHARFF